MITWGISANSHDAALSVFRNNELLFASQSERFSGIKNDPDLNEQLIEYAKKFGEPELVCWYEKPIIKTIRQLTAGQGWTWKENNIKRYLKSFDIDVPIKFSKHHHSHAAAGYYTSTFNEACVIVIDAIGEFETLTIWHAEGKDLRKLYSVDYPFSVGLWYSAMTQRIGLIPNEEEYILMGMAAYGNPDRLYKDIIKDFIYFPDPLDDGNLIYFKENLHKGCKYWRPDLTSEQDLFDIAAATQAVYETILIKTLEYAKRLVPSDNLVFMGGCALNCKANPLAYRYFKNLWIMPAPGDSGSAIGAVLAQTKEHVQWPGPFLGYDMSYHSNDEKIVDYLIKHKICGLARGPAEFGPRALGNRSLLADPRTDDIKDRVNEIKQRQKFRPFAPAILAELADDYFDIPSGSSPYMQMVARCRNPELFPAVVHADGTSRVQTVAADGSPFRRLLELWYKQTGCPMLLNTSLNVRGKPMVNDHKDALAWEREYKIPIFN